MPFLSPKMNGFIFGFQRFVWCPKWTPASNRSFIAIALKLLCPLWRIENCRLTFAELEPFARAGHAVFLAFLGARIARHQSGFAQPRTQFRVVLDERARNAEA